MSEQEKYHLQDDGSTGEMQERFLVLHNDDVHSFDYVIDALVKTCKHDMVQAEQCTMIVHFKGKCTVKEGNFNQLKPIKDKLIRMELNATID